MMGIPIWLWVVAAVLIFASGLGTWIVYAHRAFRADVRRRFLLFLEKSYPDIQIFEESADFVRLQVGEGEPATLFLRRLYRGAAELRLEDREGYRKLFEMWADVIMEASEGEGRGPEEDRQRLMPRLVTRALLQGLSSGDVGLPSRELEGLSLYVLFVLDGRHSVSFVNDSVLETLDLSAEGAWQLALHNLRRRGGDFSLNEVVGGAVQVIQTGDTYDAARLLLLPEQLAPGQLLAAAIPDRDTLVLAPMPADGDWTFLRKVARTAGGEVLLDRPVRVSREGFEVV